MYRLVIVVVVAACGGHRPVAGSQCPAPRVAPPEQPRLVLDRRHARSAIGLAYSADGKWLASLSEDQSVHVWDGASGGLVQRFALGGKARGDSILDRVRYTLGWDRNRLWYGFGAVERRELGGAAARLLGVQAYGLQRLPDGTWVGLAAFEHAVVVLDADGKELRRAQFPQNAWGVGKSPILSVAPDASALVIATGTHAVRISPAEIDGRTIIPQPYATDHSSLLLVAALPRDGGVVMARDDGLHLSDGGTLPLPGGDKMLFSYACFHGLAVNPGGDRVAAATCAGVFVWDVATRKLVWERRDDAYSAIAFGTGQIAAATLWGGVRTFDAASGRLARELGAAIAKPDRLAFVGDDRLAVIAIRGQREESTLSAYALATATRSGRWLLSPGRNALVEGGPDGVVIARSLDPESEEPKVCDDNERHWVVQRWTRAELDRGADGGATDRGKVCIPDAYGGIALNAGTNRLLVSESMYQAHYVTDLATGKPTLLEGAGANHLLGFTPDGSRVFGSFSGLMVKQWDAATGKPIETPGVMAGGNGTIRASNELVMVGHDDRLELHAIATGTKVDVTLPFRATRTAIAGATVVATGGDGQLAVVRDGKVIAQGASDGGEIETLVASPSATRAATISDDGAIRVWDLATARTFATLVEFADDEWLAFTPQGDYTGTSEAASRVSWVFPNLEAFRFEQFASAFESRERVAAAIGGKLASSPGVPHPPRVRFASPPPGRTADAKVRMTVAAESVTGLASIRLYGDGRLLGEQRVCGPSATATFDVALVAGPNLVTAVAFDDRGLASNPARVRVVSESTAAARPDLWIVSAGVSKYPRLDSQWQLTGADHDARTIAAAFERVAKTGGYGRPHTVLLENEQVTRDTLVAAVRGLRAMRPQDVAIIFLAGHGWKPAEQADMLFLTSTTVMSDLAHDAISWTALREALAGVQGRVVILVDACHAGHISQERVIPNDHLARELAHGNRAGIEVIAASKGRQLSYEKDGARALAVVKRKVETEEVGGLFATAVARTLLDPAADRDLDGVIELSELVDHVTAEVVRVSKGMQTPWVARHELFGDVGLAAAPAKE